MIDLLASYARSHALIAEPGFTSKTVKWALDFTGDGAYHGVLPLGDPGDKKNTGRAFPCCPDLSQPELVATKGCHFLVETAEVVALLGVDPANPAAAAKAASKHTFFVELVSKCSNTLRALEAIRRSLSNSDTLERIRADLTRLRARPTDKVTLRLDGTLVIDDAAWHDWWRSWRAENLGRSAATATSSAMISFVSGDAVKPAKTHPKIAGLSDVGGNSSGSALVSFDKDAFPSYGLKQSANAAMSEQEASLYREALNDLIASRSRRLVGAKVVHWFSKSIPDEDDPFPELFEGADDEVAEARAAARAGRLLEAIRTGRRPELLDAEYFAVTLSGSGGRVMIRDFMTGRFEALAASITAWFDDLAIVQRNGQGLAHPPKFLAVCGATARTLEDVPPPLLTRLWHVAVSGGPVPYQAMAQALARASADVIAGQPPNHARMGLLRAYYVRRGDINMSAFLNEEHPEPAYHCGRLLALYSGLQGLALPNVDAGVIQRFYAAASTTPALVLGRIARTSQFHLSTVRADRPALATWYERRIASVWAAIADRLPAVLTLEQQGLFALGYYHQLADRPARAQSPENTDNSEGDTDA